eukprot:737323-Amphidinium_carterae.1
MWPALLARRKWRRRRGQFPVNRKPSLRPSSEGTAGGLSNLIGHLGPSRGCPTRGSSNLLNMPIAGL